MRISSTLLPLCTALGPALPGSHAVLAWTPNRTLKFTLEFNRIRSIA